jgi:hypothetical protein
LHILVYQTKVLTYVIGGYRAIAQCPPRDYRLDIRYCPIAICGDCSTCSRFLVHTHGKGRLPPKMFTFDCTWESVTVGATSRRLPSQIQHTSGHPVRTFNAETPLAENGPAAGLRFTSSEYQPHFRPTDSNSYEYIENPDESGAEPALVYPIP